MQDGLTVDPERDPVSRFDFGPIQLCTDRRRGFGTFQRMDTDVQQRIFLCRVAERFQKERTFVSGFLWNDHRPLLCKNAALVLTVNQTADVRAVDGLTSAQIDTDTAVIFGEGNICFHGFLRKSRRQGQLAAHTVVI